MVAGWGSAALPQPALREGDTQAPVRAFLDHEQAAAEGAVQRRVVGRGLRVAAEEASQVVPFAGEARFALHQFAQHRVAGDDRFVERAFQQRGVGVRPGAFVQHVDDCLGDELHQMGPATGFGVDALIPCSPHMKAAKRGRAGSSFGQRGEYCSGSVSRAWVSARENSGISMVRALTK